MIPSSREFAISHGFFVMYYGPECVAKKVQEWIEDRHINARFIDPGSPWQNGHNESFNGVFRDGCLNRWLFESVREAREATERGFRNTILLSGA
jgi:transposase InsO family protein